MSAYDKGVLARQGMYHLSANPYDCESTEWEAWRAGWYAMHDSEDDYY